MSDERLARLYASMRRRRLDAYLSVCPSNIRYLTGFTGEDSALLVTGGGAFLLTDGRFDIQARNEVRGTEVVITNRKYKEAARRLRLARSRRIGYESHCLSMESFHKCSAGREERWVSGSDLVEPLRMRKELREILAIEAASVAAAASLMSVISSGLNGKTERDVAADLEREMKRRGAEEPSFPTIVAYGARSAMPHAIPTWNRIGTEGPLIIDFGAKKGGYCSDETVTVFPGNPQRSLRKVRDAVRRAQDVGISSIGPGVACKMVDARVRESLDRSGYLKYFVHSTGHGVGLDVHERPTLSPRSKDLIEEGMVVTVEPGVYLPGIGGVRLEDTVKVTGSGCERVTFLPKAETLLT
ncbi:MAG: aminopeptidase P family protein [Syntrophorhabdaceae bacterium]|nr:aminopeptidase P family protein [Syntrophorhabdaceae bacterium]